MTLTQERLKELLHYDPDTGEWRWRVYRAGNARAGSIAGSIQPSGRRSILVDGRLYRSARLAFLYMTGSWPTNEAEHEDTNPGNDRWLNLRDATRSQNNANKGAQRNNKLGVKGVSQLPSGKYRAQIMVDGRQICLGATTNLALAGYMYQIAAAGYYGAYARAA